VELREIEGAIASVIQHYIALFCNRPGHRNIFFRVIRKIVHTVLFSVMNCLALKLDRCFCDEKFCLPYLLVA
jgi:hypothetical protein